MEIKYRAFGSWGKRKGKWWFGTNQIDKYKETDKKENYLNIIAFERLIKGEILNPNTRGRYTGLKDNNNTGVDIYEGDIVYLAGKGNTEIEFPFVELYEALYENDIGNIIGNIYENKDLLA